MKDKDDAKSNKLFSSECNDVNKSTTPSSSDYSSRESPHSHAAPGESYHIAKWIILRLTGVIYFVAFLGAYHQNKALMGTNGLIPASEFMDTIRNRYPSSWDGFMHHPTIFWWLELSDQNMDLVSLSGMTLSALVIMGEDSMILMFLLWLLDFSIVTIASGNNFYAYGWESQILETGFLAMFLCDLMPQFGRYGKKSRPSPIILWLFRWLSFRISIGAGLIKIRGDSCWTNKTCLYYHFETQPIPSPMSFFFHFLPKWALRHAVDLDLFVQVYTSWFVLAPSSVPGLPTFVNQYILRKLLRLGGYIQAGFMINILLSGNFAFLNHLTIIPALACLDDECWPLFLQRILARNYCHRGNKESPSKWKRPRLLIDVLFFLLIAKLSWPVVDNLFQLSGGRQQMNASFDRFRLVNTYGAFGSVGKGRYEPIVSISYDGKEWIELEFPCKPGTVTRRPCFCAPYHYRADWNIWFIGFKPHRRMLEGREAWMFSFFQKLLEKGNHIERPWLDILDPSSATLLREKYMNEKVPRYIKVDMYRYRMAKPIWKLMREIIVQKSAIDVVWWKRNLEEPLIPPFNINQDGEFQLVEGSLDQSRGI